MNSKTPKEAFGNTINYQPFGRLFDEAERKTERPDIWTYRLSPDVIENANLGFELDELPEYIGVVGGAARQMLEALVTGRSIDTLPRDVDLAVINSIVEQKNYDPEEVEVAARELSSQFSPRDAEYGHTAKIVDRVEDYMGEQDFAINQVLIEKIDDSWVIQATTQAVQDTAAHIIRPTIYEHDVDEGYYLGPKLALKTVRLLSEMQVNGVDDARIEGVEIPGDTFGDLRDSTFWQVLQLDKAMESGIDVANQYVKNLRKLGAMPYDLEDETTVSLYKKLLEMVDFEPSDGALETLWPYGLTRKLGALATGEFRYDHEELLWQVPPKYLDGYVSSKK